MPGCQIQRDRFFRGPTGEDLEDEDNLAERKHSATHRREVFDLAQLINFLDYGRLTLRSAAFPIHRQVLVLPDTPV